VCAHHLSNTKFCAALCAWLFRLADLQWWSHTDEPADYARRLASGAANGSVYLHHVSVRSIWSADAKHLGQSLVASDDRRVLRAGHSPQICRAKAIGLSTLVQTLRLAVLAASILAL
jgi:hypothetical protein